MNDLSSGYIVAPIREIDRIIHDVEHVIGTSYAEGRHGEVELSLSAGHIIRMVGLVREC